MSDFEETKAENQEQPMARWQLATEADAENLDFEEPLGAISSISYHECTDLYLTSVESAKKDDDKAGERAVRIFDMLVGITSMYLQPKEPNEPFVAKLVLANGNRSALLSDFRAQTVLIGKMAERACIPILRARLADVAWLLDRRNARAATIALEAYTEMVLQVERGEAKFSFSEQDGVLHFESSDLLRRALTIARATGFDKPAALKARELAKRLREKSVTTKAIVPALWFSELCMDLRVCEPGEVASGLNDVGCSIPETTGLLIIERLWRLAANAYDLAGQAGDKDRCLGTLVERLVAEAEAPQNSAMRSAIFLSKAISELHGQHGKKERRAELQHKLIDVQARIPEEMTTFSNELDLTTLAESARNRIGSQRFFDTFFVFSDLSRSPDPDHLRAEAKKAINEFPLSSSFPAVHLDREGKFISHSLGANFGEDENASALSHKISQSEGMRRIIMSFGTIEPARQTIVNNWLVTEDALATLLQYSQFIPSGLIGTFARGFTHFFRGDFISALYILTTLLEASVRHVLKTWGHDVTKFYGATQIQQDRTISTLFSQMRNELDSVFTPAIVADLDRVFLTKPGPHLRHAVAHGLLHDGDSYGPDAIYGMWLIFRLCLMPLYRDQVQICESLNEAFQTK